MIPEINTFRITKEYLEVFWKASPETDIVKWNIYGSKDVTINFFDDPRLGVVLPGNFELLDTVPNQENAITPGSVFYQLDRDKISLAPEDPYYLLITSINRDGIESSMFKDSIHALPFMDDHHVDEAGMPVNIVYKSFEFDMWGNLAFDSERYLDFVDLMGRPARDLKVDTVGGEIKIKFESLGADAITIRENQPYPFDLKRGELRFKRMYLSNPTSNDVTVRIFIAG